MLFAIFIGVLIAEVSGYVIHRMLHAGSLGSLSSSHMQHHLRDFPPGSKMRSSSYRSAARDRLNIIGVGMEWLLPSAFTVGLSIICMSLVGASASFQLVAMLAATTWAIVGINYMHDAMHVRDFWMLRIPILSAQFKRVRRLHDVHHAVVDERGRMVCNFGIVFHVLDCLVGTFKKHPTNKGKCIRIDVRLK